MKAYELDPSGEAGPNALTLVERKAPELGPTDVRIRVRAVSLNFRDLAIAENVARLKKPIIPVSDGAGDVIAVGAQVKTLSVGDRVAGAFFQTWIEGGLDPSYPHNALGGTIDGMLAEEVVLPASGCVALPASMSFEQAATLPCAAVTAYHALFVAAAVRPGQSLLVQGTGGVSIVSLQLARSMNVAVVATSSSAEKRARLISMGVSAAIDYRENPAWGKAVREATGGRGVDVAVEVGGAGTFDQSIVALRHGGTMGLIGTLSGMAGPVNTYAILQKGIRVHGIYVGSVAMFRDLLRAVESARIEPVIDRTFPFDEAQAAYAYLASGAHFGKVVVTV